MLLNIGELVRNPGAQQEFSFLLKNPPEGVEFKFKEPVLVQGLVVNNGHSLELKSEVQIVITAGCDRCLEPVELPLQFSIHEEYVQGDTQVNDGEQDSSMAISFKGDYLNLAEAVQQNLLLNLPMRIVCSKECPGLCPSCGANLKRESCKCAADTGDPRMALLAKIKERL